MKRNQLTVFALAAALTAGVLTAGTAITAAASPAAPSPAAKAGHWGNAHQVAGLDKLSNGMGAAVTQVSCPPQVAPGNCTAAGIYRSGTSFLTFVTNERNGNWGRPVPVPVPVAPGVNVTSAELEALSCGAAGSCVVVGSFSTAGASGAGFFAEEEDGRWVAAQAASGGTVQSIITAVSCASAGNCVAGGFTLGPSGPQRPFLWAESSGSWGNTQEVQGLSDLQATDAAISAISCPPLKPGNCTAMGTYRTSATGPTQVFATVEQDFSWGNAQPVPEMSMLKATDSFAPEVSCASPGDCGIAGSYTDNHNRVQVFIAREAGGTVSTPQQVPGTGKLNTGDGGAGVDGVACAAAGNCTVAGFYTDMAGGRHAFTDDETNGTWQAVRSPAGRQSEATSVSCATTGNCVAAGYVNPGGATQAFTVSKVNGTWGKAHVLPGIAALNTGKTVTETQVSCAAPGSCAAGGTYVDADGRIHGFLDAESPSTATSLKLSGGTVRFGHEQGEKLSVTVTPRTGGIPGGKVSVTAASGSVTGTGCVLTLAGGKGSCTLGAKALKPGRYEITASYGGSHAYAGSTSGSKTLTVTK
jgi:hypothetical protein